MAVKISGVLKDGAGKPVQNCTIQLKAKRNSTTVVVNTVASENPDEAGRYSMDVEYGQYAVILLVDGFPPSHAGTITVYEDSQPGTLNDFLGAMTEDDARPEALRRFELMVEEVAQNTAAAKKSAGDASTSASEAATHATDAAGYARAAEQAKTDIDITLAGTLKTVNHLSEIAEAGTEAQQESRDNLGVKSAALLDVQSNIYDRTAGCLALPGAFGYGHVFSSSEVVYFSAQNGPAEFLKWVFEVTPGRYAVTQYGGSSTSYNPIIAYDMGQPYFRGLVDIDIRYGINSGGIEAEAGRWITFHGDTEYSEGFGEGPAKYQVLVKKSMRPSDLPEAWSRLFWSRKRLMQLLYATENTSKRPPLPGGLVLAAYLPDDGSSEVTLLRAQGVSGSRLRQVVFEAEYRTSGFSAAARSFVYGSTLPGTYVALSGGPDVKFYNRGLVSLFVRIA
ncbi:prophage tail fiber N-terminal domain-containing protein [Escherichia coli]